MKFTVNQMANSIGVIAVFTIIGATQLDTRILVDPWGDPIHYCSFPSDAQDNERETHNPTYDLCSTGGKPKDPEKWITNW